MRVGYARVSTTEQNIEAQLERLSDCEKIFSEKKRGSLVECPELAACLEYVRQGDTLVVTRLDRLARSVTHLCAIADTLRRKNVCLVVLDQAIDTSTPTGKLLFLCATRFSNVSQHNARTRVKSTKRAWAWQCP
jgi:DNA invertase Pin-like site-specific DNA recombinase